MKNNRLLDLMTENNFLSTIRKSFIFLSPFMIIVSFFTLLTNFPITEVNDYLSKSLGEF